MIAESIYNLQSTANENIIRKKDIHKYINKTKKNKMMNEKTC